MLYIKGYLSTTRQKCIICQIYGFLCDLGTDPYPASAGDQRSNEGLGQVLHTGLQGHGQSWRRHCLAEECLSLRPKYVPEVFFFFLQHHCFLLMEKITASNPTYPTSAQGSGPDLFTYSPTRRSSRHVHKELLSLGLGSCSCKCSFFLLVMYT